MKNKRHFRASQTGEQAQAHGGPLTIITFLFFMMGFITSLNDILIPHLKAIYTLSYLQAMLVQFCFFGAYFVVSLPASAITRRFGYQKGAVTGFVIAAIGCAMFYPAATAGYGMFLAAFFVLASGITLLQVAANPYVTVLGDARTASSRLTLVQAFNSLGTTVAPALGGMLILSQAAPAGDAGPAHVRDAASVQMPYLGLGALLLGLAVIFAVARIPQVQDDGQAHGDGKDSVFAHKNLVLGIIGIFCYVGAEVSIGSFLVSFFGDSRVAGLSPAAAAHFVSFYWGGAMVGRFIGMVVMRYISPGRVLAFNASCSIALVLCAMQFEGPVAMWAIIAVGLCNSVMFPTIFSMALNKVGKLTNRGSGLLCMGIVGGAIVPSIQGLLADNIGLRPSFVLPVFCYAFILYFGLKYAGMYQEKTTGIADPLGV